MIFDGLFKRIAKALYDRYPDLQYRVPIFRSTGGSLAGQQSPLDYERAANLHNVNVWMRRAIGLIGDALSPLPLEVLNTRTKERTTSHPLIALFEHVNDRDDPAHLWRQWSTDLLLSGESGFELVTSGRGQYAEIWARQPQTISIEVAKGVAARYGVINGYKITDGYGEPYLLPPNEMVFFKFYNPLNPWRGLSPVGAIRTGVMIDEFARAWARLFFENSARPDVVIVAQQGITPSEREEIERKFGQKFGGIHNAFGAVVLEEGVTDVKPISFQPVDTQWLEQRKFSRSEIAGIYGVPEEIIGFGKDTYENFETALKVFYVLTIQPLALKRDSQLTEFFKRNGALRDYERIVTDFSGVEVLQENRSRQIEDARGLWEMGTPANMAFETVGLNLMIPGGDEPRITPERLPQQMALPAPVKKAVDIPFGSVLHRSIIEHKQVVMLSFERDLQRAVKAAFLDQQRRLEARLREYQQFETDADVPETKQNLAALVDVEAEVRRWRDEFEPLFLEAIEAAGLDAFDELGLEIDFDLDRPEVRAEVDSILSEFALKVNDTTFTDLGQLFRDAEAEGLGIDAIIDLLRGYWSDRTADYQLERIARTTMTAINNAGDQSAWSQSDGVVVGKMWLSALAPNTRDAHRDAHGQTRRIGEMYEVGGELLRYPGDAQGRPGNIINCQCSQAPVLAGEEQEAGI